MIGSETVVLRVPGTTAVKDRLGVTTYPPVDHTRTGWSVQPKRTDEQQSNTDLTEAQWEAYAPPADAELAATTDCVVLWRGREFQVWGETKPWYTRLGIAHHVTIPLKEFHG